MLWHFVIHLNVILYYIWFFFSIFWLGAIVFSMIHLVQIELAICKIKKKIDL